VLNLGDFGVELSEFSEDFHDGWRSAQLELCTLNCIEQRSNIPVRHSSSSASARQDGASKLAYLFCPIIAGRTAEMPAMFGV